MASFAAWLAQEMPAGTIISDPQWWAPRIVARAAALLQHHPDARAGLEAKNPRPLEEWHEDMGSALWWRFPIKEPPYVGCPLCSDWSGYHTHWTAIIVPDEPLPSGGEVQS